MRVRFSLPAFNQIPEPIRNQMVYSRIRSPEFRRFRKNLRDIGQASTGWGNRRSLGHKIAWRANAIGPKKLGSPFLKRLIQKFPTHSLLHLTNKGLGDYCGVHDWSLIARSSKTAAGRRLFRHPKPGRQFCASDCPPHN